MTPSFFHYVFLADLYHSLSISKYDISAPDYPLSFSNIHLNTLGAEGKKFDIPQLTSQVFQRQGA
jgi:hypothetical protein